MIEQGSAGIVECTECERRVRVTFNAPDFSPESEHWPQHCGKPMKHLKGRFDELLQEIISCKTCGGDTTMLGTKLCDPCWELDKGWRELVRRDKDKARDWLQAQVDRFSSKHQRE